MSTVLPRRIAGILLLTAFGLLAQRAAYAANRDESLPPRSEWHASSSSVETPALASALAIDGDDTTRWGGAFSPGNWLQVDLGRASSIGGALIHWDSGFATAYSIQSSIDGQDWHVAFETTDSQGAIDYVFFPVVQARYLRLAAPARTSDWGVSVFEFEPLSAHDAPRISGVASEANAAALWSDGKPVALKAPARGAATSELHIALPRALQIAGLEVFWAAPRDSVRLDARDASNRWQLLADDPSPLGDVSTLAAREARTVSELRLSVTASAGKAPAIRRLRLLSPARVMTPMKR